jgi:PadR family transcriptional regulator, regulatory protein PadR
MADVRGDALRGHLDLLILKALRDEPSHGYRVIQRLRERSDQLLDLPEGSVYPALHRLHRAGYLSGRWQAGDGPRKRVYQVTARGSRELERQLDEWNALVRAMTAVLKE